ncbi:MAG: ABC transporter permease [Chthoniobacterales bacterium]
MLADLRYALRQLFKNPAFTLVAVLTLGLGIGANTAIFSVVNAVLLKPLPFPSPNELIAFGSSDKREQTTSPASLSFPDFFDFRDQNQTLASAAVYRDRAFGLVDERETESVRGEKVSSEFFEVLGVKPLLGHGFARADDGAGGGPGGYKVVLSDALWRGHFNADKNVLGKTLLLDGRAYLVIGVLPPGFQFPIQTEAPELYVTTAEDASSPDGSTPNTQQRGNHSLEGIARLKAGVTAAQASADLRNIAARLEKQFPDTNTNFGVAILPLRDDLVGDIRTGLYVLFGAVLCVLLIANANVANLLLARASVRGKEIALRAALGASRARIIRQLLTESVLLAALGGGLGLLIAGWGTSALIAAVPQNIPRTDTIQLDGAVLAFTLLLSLGTGIIFGLVPAWQASHIDLNTALKTGARGTAGGDARKHRLRNGLVIAEVSLALVLLICAGLLIQSFSKLGRVQPGLRTDKLFTARLGLPEVSYPKPESMVVFYDQLLARIRALPGVEAASVITPLPLSGSNMATTFDIEEHPLPEGQQADAASRVAGVDCFKALGIPLLQGRVFTESDQLKTQPVVIVNERFAQKFFPGQNVVGKRIQPGMAIGDEKASMRTIIGVVGNVKYRSLSRDFTPEMYLPIAQMPFDFTSLVVRTSVSNPATITNAVRAQLAAVDRNIPLMRVRIFDEYLTRSLARPRFNALLLSIFAGTALLLTAIGIYGVMAYSVSQRTNEIGIRIALGAAQSSIFRLIVGQAMTLVGISLVIGLAGAFAATRLLSTLVYGVGVWDPLTFVVIVILLSVVAFFAAWLPARRAARVNPIVALRTE